MNLTEKIEELKISSANQTAASQNLAQEVANKMNAIDHKTLEARQICVDAAGNLLNHAKNLSAWTVPESTITISPAKRIGVEDPTVDHGSIDIAETFNPTKLGKDGLLRIADFDHPNWSGGKESWNHTPRFTEEDNWNGQTLKDAANNPCFFHLASLLHYPRLINRYAQPNVSALLDGKIPYFLMRCTVEGQIHGMNRTFIELLINSNGSSSNMILDNGDGTNDTHTPNSVIFGGGFQEKGYPVPVESAGYGGKAGLYSNFVAIPLNQLYSLNQNILIVNVGFKTLHIHSFGFAYFHPQGLEVN